jgi:CDP-paratose 2-epimerase
MTKLASLNGHRKDGTSPRSGKQAPALITGGAGFIGTNLADKLLSNGMPVIVFDNMSRAGVEHNLKWLTKKHGGMVDVRVEDIRDLDAVRKAVKCASRIYHFAAQVAVTTSLDDPFSDFEVNARGTLNLLEAARERGKAAPPMIFTSTNKVYGALDDVALKVTGSRYLPVSRQFAEHGISEKRSIEFHSPYGCSKGAAEQYVLDYAHTFGLPTAVFRMSCIYGEHQCGNEDQGWVAHFLIRALNGEPITLYGDGMQVRDILFAEDLVDALLLAHDNIKLLKGHAFNIGGGPSNAISLLELLEMIGGLNNEDCEVEFDDWRTADQRYYVSDTRKFTAATGWRPRFSVRQGVTRLFKWLEEQRRRPRLISVASSPSVSQAVSG